MILIKKLKIIKHPKAWSVLEYSTTEDKQIMTTFKEVFKPNTKENLYKFLATKLSTSIARQKRKTIKHETIFELYKYHSKEEK